MKRKLVSMVMCMALGATMLAGCGNSANTSTGNAGASNDAAAKTDDAAAADQTDDSAEPEQRAPQQAVIRLQLVLHRLDTNLTGVPLPQIPV